MRLLRIALLFQLLLAASAWSQGVMTVGIPTDDFNYVASAQEAHEWCWAASTQMILKWFDIDVQQADVVRRIKGKIVDQSASERDITAALNGAARQRSGHKAVIHAASVTGPPHPLVIIKQLSLRIPMLLTINTGPHSGHVVVLTAASYHQTSDGPHIDSLIVRDPYPTPYNLKNQGRIELSGPTLRNFVNCISRSWMVWVTPEQAH